jgi:hypothetical protein
MMEYNGFGDSPENKREQLQLRNPAKVKRDFRTATYGIR